jgi:hypothetical protein
MLMEHARGSWSLRAPLGDGQTLIDPAFSALPDVVAGNRERFSQARYDFQGRSLADLSAGARRSLLASAVSYTEQYRDIPDSLRHADTLHGAPLVLSGHQPQLFHPGVWYKNFVLGALAERLDGVGVHLLIDGDLCRSVSIRVPTGTLRQPRVEAVPYDEPAAEVPYEERSVRGRSTLASFAGRVSALLEPLVPDPLLTALWPLVLQRNPGQQNLGLRLAQGRHALEESWGNATLELPQSAVCQLPEFAWFAAHVLAHLPRFWSTHNDALAAYRRTHRLRNRAHPVPDLMEVDGWLEAPFWIWSSEDPKRRPLFAKQDGDDLVISDRHARTVRLVLSGDRDASVAVEQLLNLAESGVKIRTRALTTTLFARLALADLFLHGIGGAKYDQVTDQIVREFFGFQPPEFATVSATLRLPVARDRVDVPRVATCQQQLRELRYHPERFVERVGPGDGVSANELIALKQRWVRTPKTPQNARERHLAIVAANTALQPLLADVRRQIKSRCTELEHHKRAEAILQSREYSFCLFPREHFERLLHESPLQ